MSDRGGDVSGDGRGRGARLMLGLVRRRWSPMWQPSNVRSH